MSAKKQFPLRLDPKIYEALELWSSDEFRSVNSHIEFVLREALKNAGRLPGRPNTNANRMTPSAPDENNSQE
ncbi:hypothetical protein E0485_15855 [Paenibacillus albiflavus]|uniref:Toxin-antitoxin system HicB family antitoxin n=1 Tax=Paenibacillus albiflavus TaxID=2545760 RepID=A0A4R4ED07_9BACL|nr:hypothetical protein [Paenibacillus albiflavus]TCZ75848.1 hypothetical protein E0485_15855 [Paenibacillus albiflavus]